MRKRKFFFFYLASLLPTFGWGGEWSRRRRTKMFPGTDEQEEVFELLKECEIPPHRVLCLSPMLCANLSPDMVRHLLKVGEDKTIVVLSSEGPVVNRAAEQLAQTLGCKHDTTTALSARRNVMMDNRKLLLYITSKPEEHIVIVADHFRIVNFLIGFIHVGWDLRIPQYEEGVLIDPQSKHARPI